MFNNYDQWKTASPWDECEPIVDFTEELKSLGKRGHGLCGKNADLDYGGQIKVVSAILELGNEPPVATIMLSVYANICTPTDPEKAEIATEIVCGETDCFGEWTGEDYWTFDLGKTIRKIGRNNAAYYYLYVEMPFIDPVETEPEDVNKETYAEFAYKAVFKDPSIQDFQASMADLAKTIDAL
jgi:hypothetical protein